MSEPEIVEQVITRAGHDQAATANATPQATEPEVTPAMRSFLDQVLAGKLPDLGEVPQLDPQILALAKELTTIHLPEWHTPTGRKLASPTTTEIKGAVRIAAYLFDRGVRVHPELESVRWIPTPGGPPGAFDLGLHITPDEDGAWPDPDPEIFWDITDIAVQQQNDGTWIAVHPRGVEFTAASKSEAYAGLVYRLRRKIEEAQHE